MFNTTIYPLVGPEDLKTFYRNPCPPIKTLLAEFRERFEKDSDRAGM